MADRRMTASPLASFLFEVEEHAVNEVTKRLRESALDHYRQMETIDLRPRIQANFDAYRQAVLSSDAAPFRAYVADIGRKRLQQGYGLGELLLVYWTRSSTSSGRRRARRGKAAAREPTATSKHWPKAYRGAKTGSRRYTRKRPERSAPRCAG